MAKKEDKRWAGKNPRDREFASRFSRPRFPEWDCHPTGQLSFELEQRYIRDGSPRRSFRDLIERTSGKELMLPISVKAPR